jgi:predicted nucleic acid-binding protein
MSPSRPKPPEAVGDTDILVSGAGAFVRPASLSEPTETELLRRWLNEDWVWVTSEPLLAEYEEILLRGGAPLARVQRILAQIKDRARIVTPHPVATPLRDPGDAAVIGTARASGAPIVTRNVNDYPASLVTVCTPEEMIARIEAYLKDPMYRRRQR